MSLKQKISDDMKAAMKAHEKTKVNVLRMLLSEFKYAQAATNAREELSDDETLKAVNAYFKKLEKSLADFPEGDAKAAVRHEMEIIATYLPAPLSVETIDAAISTVLAEQSERAFGPLMKLVMAKLGSEADGKAVSSRLKLRLN